MNTNTPTTDLARIKSLLAAAGIPATQVADCQDDRCPWCRPDPVPVAA